MRFVFAFILITVSSLAYAQNHLSTPLEIISFMEASPTVYELEQLYGKVPRQKPTVLKHGTYIEQIEEKEYQRSYLEQESEKEKKWRQKARDLIAVEKPNYKKARKFYHKILKQKPNNAQALTFIGETYYEQQNYTEAIRWFDKAIALNPIDYLARWLTAEIFFKQDNIDSAVYHITLAHIYNRNHPRLLIRLQEIYEKADLTYYRNWKFAPKCYTYKEGNKVVITADAIWLTYGMYKAVWQYEPDYVFIKSQQKVTDYLFQEEMEAIIGTFMTYSELKKDDQRNYPSMNAMAQCLDYQMVEEFVMYEILLVDKPTIAHHITDNFMQKLIRYITTIRSQDFTNNNNP